MRSEIVSEILAIRKFHLLVPLKSRKPIKYHPHSGGFEEAPSKGANVVMALRS